MEQVKKYVIHYGFNGTEYLTFEQIVELNKLDIEECIKYHSENERHNNLIHIYA